MRGPKGRRGQRLGAAAAAVVAGAAMLLAAGGSVADGAGRPGTAAPSVHSGSWTATGICPFDYWFDTSGQSYQDVTTSGTLSGFTPGKAYYVYDNQGTPTTETPAAVIADARGRIVLHAKTLIFPGPACSPITPSRSLGSTAPTPPSVTSCITTFPGPRTLRRCRPASASTRFRRPSPSTARATRGRRRPARY